MSYIRFGEADSSVYVYLTIDGGIECCGCSLSDCYEAGTAEEMADHLREHLAAGDVVPEGVIERILANPELDPLKDRPDSPFSRGPYFDHLREHRTEEA